MIRWNECNYEDVLKREAERFEKTLASAAPKLKKRSEQRKNRNLPEDSIEGMSLRGPQMFANNCMKIVEMLNKKIR